jgi:hypothetical protein
MRPERSDGRIWDGKGRRLRRMNLEVRRFEREERKQREDWREDRVRRLDVLKGAIVLILVGLHLSLWPFPSQMLPSDLSGLIVLPNTTRYFVPYSEHTTLFPPFQIGRVLISGWNWIGLSCLPKAFIYLASNTADGLSAFFTVFLYLLICFHNFSVINISD